MSVCVSQMNDTDVVLVRHELGARDIPVAIRCNGKQRMRVQQRVLDERQCNRLPGCHPLPVIVTVVPGA